MIDIYSEFGQVIITVPITANCKRKRGFNAENSVELEFVHPERLPIKKGCYVMYTEERFTLYGKPTLQQDGTGVIKYNLLFEKKEGALKNHITKLVYKFADKTVKEISFSMTANLAPFAKMLADAASDATGETWGYEIISSIKKPGSTAENEEFSWQLKNDVQTISFTGKSIRDDIMSIAQAFECDVWFTENTIHFGKIETYEEVVFEQDKAVASFDRSGGDNSNFGTRFYVFGGTKNLTPDYNKQHEVSNHISETRLRLPNGENYIDAVTNLPDAEVVEQYIVFDEIFPKNDCKVTTVDTADRKFENSDNTYKAYILTTAAGFNPATDRIEGEDLKLLFTSGNLWGRAFGVSYNETTFDNKFELIPDVLTEGDAPIVLPNEFLAPKENDTFILVGCKLSEEKIKDAEAELLAAALVAVANRSKDTDVYNVKTNVVHCSKEKLTYDIGQRVLLKNNFLFGPNGRPSRISGYERSLSNPYSATYTCGNNAAYSRLGELEKSLKSTERGISGFAGGEGHNHDSKYLSKTTPDTATEEITFKKGVKTTGVESDKYSGTPTLRAGFKLFTNDNGEGILNVNTINADKLVVDQLTYNKIRAIGGTLIISPAWATVTNVNVTDTEVTVYYQPEDGLQMWMESDQPRMINGERRFWGVITSVSEEQTASGEHYFKCSLAGEEGDLFMGNANAIKANDEFVLYGHRAGNGERSNLIILSSGSKADLVPTITILEKLTTFDPSQKRVVSLGAKTKIGTENCYISFDASKEQPIEMKGAVMISPSGDVSRPITDRGIYHSAYKYYQADRVSYTIGGKTQAYLCLDDTTSMGTVPTNGTYWKLDVSAGSDGLPGTPGESAKYIEISGPQSMKNPTGMDNVVLKASLFGGLTSYRWQYWWNKQSMWINLGVQDANLSLIWDNSEAFYNNVARIRCIDPSNTYFDEYTVLNLFDGIDGKPAYNSLLTNQNVTIPYSSDGLTPSFNVDSVYTDIMAWKGVDKIAIIVSDDSRLTITKNNTTTPRLTIKSTDSLPEDLNTFTINFTADGQSFQQIFTVSKAKAGTNGADGKTPVKLRLYARTSTAPAPERPINVTYNPQTGVLGNLGSVWAVQQPTYDPKATTPLRYLWFIEYTTVVDATTASITISKTSWTNPQSDEQMSSRDDFAIQLGYNDFANMVSAAKNGDTQIVGGFINTKLIKAENIVTDSLLASKSANIVGTGFSVDWVDVTTGKGLRLTNPSGSVSLMQERMPTVADMKANIGGVTMAMATLPVFSVSNSFAYISNETFTPSFIGCSGAKTNQLIAPTNDKVEMVASIQRNGEVGGIQRGGSYSGNISIIFYNNLNVQISSIELGRTNGVITSDYRTFSIPISKITCSIPTNASSYKVRVYTSFGAMDGRDISLISISSISSASFYWSAVSTTSAVNVSANGFGIVKNQDFFHIRESDDNSNVNTGLWFSSRFKALNSDSPLPFIALGGTISMSGSGSTVSSKFGYYSKDTLYVTSTGTGHIKVDWNKDYGEYRAMVSTSDATSFLTSGWGGTSIEIFCRSKDGNLYNGTVSFVAFRII